MTRSKIIYVNDVIFLRLPILNWNHLSDIHIWPIMKRHACENFDSNVIYQSWLPLNLQHNKFAFHPVFFAALILSVVFLPIPFLLVAIITPDLNIHLSPLQQELQEQRQVGRCSGMWHGSQFVCRSISAGSKSRIHFCIDFETLCICLLNFLCSHVQGELVQSTHE